MGMPSRLDRPGMNPIWGTCSDNVLHPMYLPFSASTLSRHFATVSRPNIAEDYLRYYRDSADRQETFPA